MRLLAIETSGPQGGIALSEDAAPIEEVRLAEGMRHGRSLLAAAKAACERAHWDPRDIGLVAVSIGPGSFTGLRIAVIVAKFIAWDSTGTAAAEQVSSGSGEQVKRQGPVLAAHLRSPAHLFACSGGARIVAVPTLRALAENAPPAAERVACILDAKRGGLYASVFERQDGRLVETLGPALLEPEAFAAQIARPALVLGRGILKARPALGGLDLAPEDLWDPRSAAVARLAWPMHERGEYADPLRLEPIYIRRPEAEEIWERRIACQPGQDPA